jgi:hypothetical protein
MEERYMDTPSRPAIKTIAGARALVDGLLREGIDHVFGIPGTQNLAFLDVLRETPPTASRARATPRRSSLPPRARASPTSSPGSPPRIKATCRSSASVACRKA